MTGALAIWERFWFSPVPTSTLAVIRVAFGLLMLGWAAALGPDLFTFFSSNGMYESEMFHQSWGLLHYFPGDATVVAVYIALLGSALCLVAGYHTRLAAIVLFVTEFSLQRRNPVIWNSGDAVIHNTAFFLALAPSGAALSVDHWRQSGARFWEFPSRALWPVRLMQIQLSTIYIFSVWAKVRGETWNDGTAVSYALRIEDLERFPLPHFVTDTPVIANLMTFGTLAVELGVGILLWNRRARAYAMTAGILLHLGIDYSLEVGFFSYAMIVLYLAFLDPEAMSERLVRLRGRLSKSRIGALRRFAAAQPP